MRAPYALRSALAACLCTALLACDRAEPQQPVRERDPAVVQALFDRLMVDPDLAGQNEANAALTTGIDHSLPPFTPSGEAIRRARAEAVELAGGEARLVLPTDLAEGDAEGADDKLPPAETFILVSPEAMKCAASLEYSARWAARMPELLPVFPQGATQNAAGSSKPGCSLLAVTFLSGNRRETIAAFYAARARGFELDYREQEGITQLTGKRGNGRFALELRDLTDGNVEATLVTFAI